MAFVFALGIGANAAVVEDVWQLLRSPLAAPRPNELVTLYGLNRKDAAFTQVPFVDYEELRTRAASFRQLAAYFRVRLHVTIDRRVERVAAEAVTDNFFETLAISSLVGPPPAFEGNAPSVVIGESFWRERFAADPNIVGTTLDIEGLPFRIAAVVPRTISEHNLGWGDEPLVWVPLTATERLVPGLREAAAFSQPGIPLVLAIGRLAEGVSLAAAQTEAEMIASELATRRPATNGRFTLRLFESGRSKVWPGSRPALVRAVTGLVVASTLLFLLSVATLAQMAIQDAVRREREIAIQAALGATRPRLFAQLFIEALVVAVPGLLLSIAFAALTQAALGVIEVPGTTFSRIRPSVGLRVVVICAALSMLHALLLAVVGSLQISGRKLAPTIADAGRGTSSRRSTKRQLLLIGGQFTLAAGLLTATALVVGSVRSALVVDRGLPLESLLLASIDVTSMRAAPTDAVSQLASVAVRLRADPRVSSVSLVSSLPMDKSRPVIGVTNGPSREVRADSFFVDAGFLTTSGIRLLAGRFIRPEEAAQKAPVAVINASLAKALWPNESAVGRSVTLRQGRARIPTEVVGVIADVRYLDVEDGVHPSVFRSAWPVGGSIPQLLIRVRQSTPQLVTAVEGELRTLPAGLAVSAIETAQERVRDSTENRRRIAFFLAGLGFISLIVGALGLLNAMASLIDSRRRDTAIRMALGGAWARVALRTLGIPAMICALCGLGGVVLAVSLVPRLTASVAVAVSGDVVAISVVGITLAGTQLAVIAFCTFQLSRINLATVLR